MDRSHQRMLKLLLDVLDQSATENPYTGVEFRSREREQLKQLPLDTPDAQRARLHLLVGKDELRLGNNQAAVDHLLKAHALSDTRLVEPTFQLAVAYLR